MLQYITTLNLIRVTIKHKKKLFKVLKNKKTKRLLVIFLKLNIILGWTNIIFRNKNYYNVFVNEKFYKKIVTFIKPSKQIALKSKQLHNMVFKVNSASIFLTTNKGVLSISETFQYKCGGILLFCLL